MRPGGFGIMLSKRLVDELVYSEKGNEVFMIKNLTLANDAVVTADACRSESSVREHESSPKLDSATLEEVDS
jgi:hypothetical protein